MPDSEEAEGKHVWVRYLIQPVNVYRNDADGEPYVEYDVEALKQTLKDPDTRIGCLICNATLDDGWETACPGPDVSSIMGLTPG